MPDRRHLWRGIHDPEMVKQGVTIDLKTAREGSRVQATLTITNSGVGHYFPTYLTPKVFLRMEMVDAAGRPVKGSLEEASLAGTRRSTSRASLTTPAWPPRRASR